jgi:hypothetical protein
MGFVYSSEKGLVEEEIPRATPLPSPKELLGISKLKFG